MIRRILAIAAAIALLGSGARAATCVVTGGVTALVDARGVELLGGDSIESLFAVVPDALYAAGAKGAYRLYDASGAPVGDRVFSMIRAEGEWLVFSSDGRYGAMNASGGIVVPAEWTQLVWNGADGFLALADSPMDDRPDAVIHIVPGEEPAATGGSVAGGLRDVREDRMPFMTPDGRWGYLDGRGTQVIVPEWRHAGAFSGGTAAVTGDVGRGMIDLDGGIVLAPEYVWLERGETLVAALTEEGKLEVYDASGRIPRFSMALDAPEIAIVGDAVAVYEAAGSRLIASDGRLIAEAGPGARFEAGIDGRYVRVDGAWGEACQTLLDGDGNALCAPRQRVLPLCPDRYAWLEMPGTTYYSPELDSLQVSWDYGSVRYGLMDGQGRELLPAEYREIRALDGERLLLIDDASVILADLDGRALRVWITAEDAEPTDGPDA